MVWVAAAAAAVGIGSSLIGGSKAKKKARKLGKANAAAIRAETKEAIRRTNLQFEAQQGEATAMIGGSGVKGSSGTVTTFMSNMRAEQQNQLDWMQKSGDAQANLARMGASNAGSAAQSMGQLGAIQSFQGWAGSAQGTEAFKKLGWA